MLNKATKLIGTKVGELVYFERDLGYKKNKLQKSFNLNKGKVGQLVESYLGLKNNSSKKVDFKNLNCELKVTPLKKLKNNEWVSKERLILNIINYEKDKNKGLKKSNFYKKTKKTLIIFYLHDYEDFNNSKFVNLGIWKPFENIMSNQIKEDYKTIMDKVNSDNAHNLSGKDTVYLEACTKGSTAASSFRNQEFGPKAKQRAFAFKNKYMNEVFKIISKKQKYLIK